jgi:ribosomal protein L19
MIETTVVGRGNNIHVQHGTDDNLFVRFYFNKIHEQHYIKINVPGDNKTEWDEPVKDEHKRRFAEKWKAYESEQNQFEGEVLLESCELFNESKVELYRNFNIRTVDQLAKLNDAFITKIGMGTREDVRKANAYLASLVEKSKQEHLLKELQARDDRLAQLEAMLGEMQAKESTPTPRGRKPKGE